MSTAIVGALDCNCCGHVTCSEWGGVGRAVDVWHWYGSVGFQPFVDLLLPIKISSLSSVSPLPLLWPFSHSELLQMRWCKYWHSVRLQPEPNSFSVFSYPSFNQMKSFCRYTWWVLMYVHDLGPLIGNCAPLYSWASGRLQCFTKNWELPTQPTSDCQTSSI